MNYEVCAERPKPRQAGRKGRPLAASSEAFLRTVDGGCLRFPSRTAEEERSVLCAKTCFWRLCQSRGLQFRMRRSDDTVAMWAERKTA